MNRSRPLPGVYSAVVEKARLEARKRGHNVVEQALPDGSIRVTITVGGAQ